MPAVPSPRVTLGPQVVAESENRYSQLKDDTTIMVVDVGDLAATHSMRRANSRTRQRCAIC